MGRAPAQAPQGEPGVCQAARLPGEGWHRPPHGRAIQNDDEDDEPEEEPTLRKKPKTKTDKAEDSDDEIDVDGFRQAYEKRIKTAAERAEARTEMKWKRGVGRTAARAALADAGWTGTDMSRVMKLIDIDDVDLDDEGNVIGMDEQVTSIKEEFPEWFRTSRRRGGGKGADSKGDGRGSTGDVGGSKQTPKAPKPKTWKEGLAQQAFGKRT
ncbi:hypothetical protein BJF83_20820 [Nocardiopsis sp. CNR-923]|uniref:phage scaffolding protein n=1 Tax=Nocardiopsis sp. CNR-923 TaxID=1904965 RepID=UPI00096A1357|nr:hypothetical protein [Nocardiopsis sp. CNR-923]OLT26531.1 hypothetical protein BJF83_20820 [Nocardiopsis sp. CNR-923]